MEKEFLIRQILGRYEVDIRLASPHSEMYAMKLNSDFIATLLKLFEDDPCATEEELNRYSLSTIIEYIQRTHVYYLAKKLPEIEQSIELLLMDYTDSHPLLAILRKFYLEYQADLTHHIENEERYLLPYVIRLLRAHNSPAHVANIITHFEPYSIKAFTEAHSDTEGDLRLVHETIRQYSPPRTNATPYRILLTQLQLFERDLAVHALIEDTVLIPRATELEKKMRQQAMHIASQN